MLVLGLTACSDDTVINVNDESKEKAKISIRVLDSYSLEPVDSVEVVSLVDGEGPSLTDKDGRTAFTGLAIGDYRFQVSKDGYATSLVAESLVEAGTGDVARVEDAVIDVPLHKLGVSVRGTVLLRDPNNGDRKPASGVTVVLAFDNAYIYPHEVSVETDDLGGYDFGKVAEGVGFSVYVAQVKDGKYTYQGKSIYSNADGMRAGEKINAGVATLAVMGVEPELIKSNFSSIGAKDTLSMTFSVPLTEDSVATAWKVCVCSGSTTCSATSGKETLVKAFLSKEGATVNIVPVSKNWSVGSTYFVSGTLYTDEGVEVSFQDTFSPGEEKTRPGNVSDLKVTESGTYYKLSWTPSKDDVDGYKIYYKSDVKADYVEYQFGSTSSGIPLDSSSCISSSYSYCDQYDEYGSYDYYEYAFFWYTATDTLKDTDRYGDYYDKYGSYDASSSKTDTTLVCDEKIESYDETLCSKYPGSFADDYSTRDTTIIIECDKDLDPECEDEKEDHTYYTFYWTTSQTTYKWYVPSDSVSCVGESSSDYDVGDCEQYYDKYGSYDVRKSKYWWYTKFASLKPEADGKEAYVNAQTVSAGSAKKVDFIVLPYVDNNGKTLTADLDKAASATIDVATGK